MKKGVKVTVASISAITIALTSIGITLNRKSPYEGEIMKEETTQIVHIDDKPTTYNDENAINLSTTVYFENGIEDTINLSPTISNINNIEDITEITHSNKSNDTMYEKFDEYTIGVINETLESISENYDNFSELYNGCNLPTKEQYINEFIDMLNNNVNSIIFVEPNDVSNQYSIRLGNAQAKFIRSTNTIIINKALDKKSQQNNLVHEVRHAAQDKIVASNECAENNMYNIFTEGDAVWNANISTSNKCSRSSSLIKIDGDLYYLAGQGAQEYPVHSRYYNMLVILAGYDAVEQCKQEYNHQFLIDSIQNRYDIDAELFLECISSVSSAVEYSNDCEEMKQFLIAEDMFLQCLQQDIEKSDTKEEVFNAFNKYRYYKLQYSYHAYDTDYNDIENKKMEEIEEELFNKVNEYQILPETCTKEIFDVCLFNVPGIIHDKEEVSLNNILYYEIDDKIYFAGTETGSMKIYDKSTNKFNYILIDDNIYDSCIPIIKNEFQKTV